MESLLYLPPPAVRHRLQMLADINQFGREAFVIKKPGDTSDAHATLAELTDAEFIEWLETDNLPLRIMHRLGL